MLTKIKIVLHDYLFDILKALWGIIVCIDRLCNALLGGDPRMTLSGRMGRDIQEGLCMICKPICWVLNKINTNHCANQAADEAGLGSEAIFKE